MTGGWHNDALSPYPFSRPVVRYLVREYVLRGVAATGWGEATRFTELAWVWEQFATKLNLAAAPGTFNVRLHNAESLARWQELQAEPGIPIVPPDATFCPARCYPVLVNDRVPGAIVVPEVDGYPPDQIEVVAAQSIRSAMHVQDGEPVILRAVVEA